MENLDQDVVNLSKSIRQVESGANFQSKGKSGEYGAYQFMPGTWKGWSAKYLGKDIPLEQATPEQQNEVAYKQIKEWKDAGHNVGEIASLWNSGNAQKYKQGWKGEATLANGTKVSYDTPAYAKRVAETYQQLKAQSQKQANQPVAQNIPPQSLGDSLTKRAEQAFGVGTGEAGKPITGIKAIVKGNVPEKLMGVSDVAGAIGGAIGDVVGAGIQKIDEKMLGGTLGKAAETIGKVPEVQEGVKQYNEWAQKNPEVSRQVGNAFNIFTSLIPASKTVSAVKNLASGGIAAELNSTYTGRKLLEQTAKKGIDPIKVLNEAADAMPVKWWQSSAKKFHASLLNEPIDKMIAIQSRIAKREVLNKEMYNQMLAAKNKIEGLKAVKSIVNQISSKPGAKSAFSKVPLLGRLAAQPEQGLINKALIAKGSKASKVQAGKDILKYTAPAVGLKSLTK